MPKKIFFSKNSELSLVRSGGIDCNNSNPELTIVVAAYRHGIYIEQCLNSINLCNINNLELIIIDDGSPDDTLIKCLNYEFSGRIQVRIYSKQNTGLVDSLYLGGHLARGEYVAFMASDDYYQEGAIKLALSTLTSDPTIDALLCQAKMFGDNNNYVYDEQMAAFFKLEPFGRLDTILSAPPAPMLIQASIFKKSFLLSLKPWSQNLQLDDWPLFISIFVAEAYQGAKIRYASDICLSNYRIHSSGSHVNLSRHLQLVEQVAKEFIPPMYRKLCLANIRIDIGLGYCREGGWGKGLVICLNGLFTNFSTQTLMRVLSRALGFIRKRVSKVVGSFQLF